MKRRVQLNEIHLSRGFATTPLTEKMSQLEVSVKSSVALALGIVSYISSRIAMQIFKGVAFLSAHTEHQSLRTLSSMVGIPAGALMVASAKIFGLTQQLAWGKYAKHPTGDGANTRLAWYGVGPLPGKDLCTLTKAFLSPSKLAHDEWSLKEWGQVQI
ncbi:MAG: hypothetical protein K1000chlam2_01489 [Chlamydiae bacterium]|nr:hypothetical protein [Chlamydiota bacterium]